MLIAGTSASGLLRRLSAAVPATDARNAVLPTWKSDFHMRVYRTLAEWEARASELRKQILSSAGLSPLPEKTPLHPEIFGRIERQDYTVEKVLLETLPGFYLGGNLYRPLGKAGKHPAVASPHGHWEYGRLQNDEICSVPARAINLARQGYVVLAYDMVGYTDTVQVPHEWGGPHGFGTLEEELWSFNTLGLQLWDSIRVVDFLESLPDVDPDRIAATGASGGGTQTFLLSAVDPRVKVAAPVNMISAHMQGGPCESAPGLRFGTFNVEIGALMAPRPLLMVCTTQDWTKNTPQEEFPAIQSIYRLYGKPALVETVQIDAPHNYNRQSREAVYRFFAKHLLHSPDPQSYKEVAYRTEKIQDLVALHDRTLPPGAVDRQQLFTNWVAMSRKQADQATPEELRDRLTRVLGAAWPAKVLSDIDGERILLSRPGAGNRIPGVWLRGSKPAALVVHPDGSRAARENATTQELVRSGNGVLMIDAYQTGEAAAARPEFDGIGLNAQLHADLLNRLFYVYNKSDAANRVQDILTALAFLENQGPSSPIVLIGLGDAAVWCMFAAALARAPVRLRANLDRFSGTDSDFIRHFFIPGIQRAGGFTAAQRLVSKA